MAKGKTNLAASVHQRLLNKAKESSRPFNELVQYFALNDLFTGCPKAPTQISSSSKEP
jgi:hypothetical protein